MGCSGRALTASASTFEGVPRGATCGICCGSCRTFGLTSTEVVVRFPPPFSRPTILQGLSRDADLYVMAYDYHWNGSSHAGPVDPLRSGAGTVWEGVNALSISSTIDEVTAAGADPAHVIVGLPLYGRAWPVSADVIPAPAVGRGRSIPFDTAWQLAAAGRRRIEPDSQSLVAYVDGRQLWFGDAMTVRQRIRGIKQQTTFAGVGFWALNHASDPAFWKMVAEERIVDSATSLTNLPRRVPVASGRSSRPVVVIFAVGVLGVLCWVLGARSTPSTRWYSGRRGETG